MAVILANAQLAVKVRAHPFARDAHGLPLAPAETETRGPYPGSVLENLESVTWTLRLDPRLWPLDAADEVTDGTRTWVISACRQVLHPIAPDIDYITATATLNPPDVP